MDDATFEAILAEAEAQDFKSEEDAEKYFNGKIKEWSRIRIKKPKIVKDEREERDPYYAMLKTEKEIASRY